MIELLVIDNATRKQRFMTLVEAAAVTATTVQEIKQALDTDGVCISLDYTIIDAVSAEEVCSH